MWKDICYKCGRQIWNGVPKEIREQEGFNYDAFTEGMKNEGYIIGYNTKSVGGYGNYREVACKSVCQICHAEESRIKSEKEMKKAMKKVAKMLKKQFSCPVCEYSQMRGYNTKVFKCSNKEEMMNHIREKHNHLRDIKDILPIEGYDF